MPDVRVSQLPAASEPQSSMEWRKSTYSSEFGCVEAAPLPDGSVAIRDSKNPEGGMLVFTRHEIHCFLQGVRGGEFDDLAVGGEFPG